MDIARDDHGGIAVLTILDPAEIDLAGAEPFREALSRAIGTARRIVLDVSRVEFFDSAAMGVLLSAHRAIEDAGGRLAIAGPTRPVLEVFRMVGFDMIFRIHPDVPAALPAVAEEAP